MSRDGFYVDVLLKLLNSNLEDRGFTVFPANLRYL